AVLAQVVMVTRGYYTDRSNNQILNDIVANTIGRIERSIDQSLLQIGNLYENGDISCNVGSRSVLDNLVLKSSKIKDVTFRVDNVTCTSSNYLGTLALNNAETNEKLFATNRNISFSVSKQEDLTGLVINWNLSETTQVSAFMNMDGIVFDVLPPAISDTSNLEILLADGTMLGFLRMDPAGTRYDVSLEATSSRFPLSVKLNMPQATFDNWNNQLPLLSIIFGLMGLSGVSFLVARGIFQTDSGAQSVLRALRNGAIFPYYQPVYCIASGDLIGFEVLARRKGPKGELLSPATFIPTIEKNGWDDKLLEVLVRDSAKNMESIFEGARITTLAFNVTPKQISQDGFVPWFIDLLNETGMPTEGIILEVTEREAIGNLEVLQRNISALRDYDITIAIDDVGTGHNGLSSIHQLRADYLKIDKLFVDGIVMDKHASSLVKMLIEIGAQYGMQIIAEGVETEEQLAALGALGVDEVQGFYMAKPMPAIDAISELAHHRAVRTKMIISGTLNPKGLASDSQLAFTT
ncbi:MAG: EAL domain-containing protein, partial [Pseudomonadota bacterium]